jgi:hypothetical protein
MSSRVRLSVLSLSSLFPLSHTLSHTAPHDLRPSLFVAACHRLSIFNCLEPTEPFNQPNPLHLQPTKPVASSTDQTRSNSNPSPLHPLLNLPSAIPSPALLLYLSPPCAGTALAALIIHEQTNLSPEP